ncbi:Piso0_000271 [Millerozyma farinosa CBS 7064]|uniref:Piso0_000271 protein n=1 Tax=Pichia sorbitophila (strain ATCC MYA-4447 / BCRC 22081 / CBS 7064 / NBRC 10061 / NRRL Y-12695) TaxID=559304 RepID=G8YTJ1_PICSO|nr:Piso0_000271 [Millerozyma farinosa CBS 7064]
MIRLARLNTLFGYGGSRQLVRGFSSSPFAMAASVFKMPAMSPTMSEGGIVSWKLKDGEEFAAGDVLLEVETDKSTIDVEAQDDGIMWEILVAEGEKGIPVGKPIAFLAEPGDDLSSLERPAIEEPEPSKDEKKAKQQESAPKKESSQKPKTPEENTEAAEQPSGPDVSQGDGVFQKANPNLKLSPAVEMLLHSNNISHDEAISKIPASGPKGRLLKGDILAYLGAIRAEAVSKVSKYVHSKEHLDLSNIKLAEPKPVSENEKSAASEPKKPSNELSIMMTLSIEEDVSKDSFKSSVENSIRHAIKEVYSERFPEYSSSPTASAFAKTDVFDDLVSPSVTKTRFEITDISYNFRRSTPAANDLFDDLVGAQTSKILSKSNDEKNVDVELKLQFNQSLVDAKPFVENFQNNLLRSIPSQQLIVIN